MLTFESKIQGIPCQIHVYYYLKVKGSFRNDAASDWDYSGYTDTDYIVLDRKGYKADWLAKKMTQQDECDIQEQIDKEMEEERQRDMEP